MELKITNEHLIDVDDWNTFVSEVYKRPYCFQQQEECKSKGIFRFTVPETITFDDEMHESIPEIVNGEKRGVKFKIWLERDPKKLLDSEGNRDEVSLELFWDRNFYPDIYTIINDLHKKDLLKTGNYIIDIE